jgi:kumamolisin
VAEAYNFPRNLTGAGQCIAMIELGGGYRESDLGSYFQSIGLKAPAVAAIGVDGGSNNPADTSGANGEVALDIEVAGAVASGAKIAVYFAPNTDAGFLDALTTAVHDRTNQPAVVSISWGGPESGWSQQALQAFDDACRSAASLGVTVCAASGDSGSSDGGSGDNVDFPASSPHVLACGGTALKAAGARRQSETVWNDQAQGGGATGGGVSTAFPVPAWQQGLSGLPAAKGGGGRGVPDVAGDASPETGYQVFFDGQSQVLGGTSAVAPLWAALLALANQQLAEARAGRRVGLAQPALYKAGNAFFDVTEGSNGDFSAGPGWDPCTGLGSPDGAAVIAALSA